MQGYCRLNAAARAPRVPARCSTYGCLGATKQAGAVPAAPGMRGPGGGRDRFQTGLAAQAASASRGATGGQLCVRSGPLVPGPAWEDRQRFGVCGPQGA